MPTRKMAPLEGGLIAHKGEAAPAVAGSPKPKLIAITVKLDPELYTQVKHVGLQHTPMKTTQDIMVEALKAYLHQHQRAGGAA